jgi:predicted NodU family carbamoyl transferase
MLSANVNPWLYDVLVEVGKVTGADCLINTSLNGRGFPICNSFDDAAREMAGFKIQIVTF